MHSEKPLAMYIIIFFLYRNWETTSDNPLEIIKNIWLHIEKSNYNHQGRHEMHNTVKEVYWVIDQNFENLEKHSDLEILIQSGPKT